MKNKQTRLATLWYKPEKHPDEPYAVTVYERHYDAYGFPTWKSIEGWKYFKTEADAMAYVEEMKANDVHKMLTKGHTWK